APGSHLQVGRRVLAAGVSFGFIAAVCQALGAVLSRKAFAMARASGESTDGITAAYQRILGGVAVHALALLWIKRDAITGHIDRRESSLARKDEADMPRWRLAWPWVIVNALAGPALGVSCYQWALKTMPTGIVLPIVAITPLVIIPFSY